MKVESEHIEDCRGSSEFVVVDADAIADSLGLENTLNFLVLIFFFLCFENIYFDIRYS